VLPEGHAGLVEFLRPLALVCEARKNYREAEQLLQRALKLTVTEFGPRHSCVAPRLSDLGALHNLTGRQDQATRRFEEAADLLRDTLGEDSPDHAAARRVLGLHYLSLLNYPMAEKALQKALEVTRRTLGENDPAVAACHETLAELRRACKDLPGAAEHYRQGLDVLRRSDTCSDALHAALLHGQALVLLQQGRWQEAEPPLRAALIIDQSAGDEATLAHLDSACVLAQLCAAVGARDEEALGLLHQVLESGLRLAPSFCCLRQDESPQRFWGQLWAQTEMLLTLATRTPISAATARFLFDAVLRLKGLGPCGMVLADRGELLRQHPGLRTQLDTRFVLGQQTANRAAAGAGPEGLEAHHRLLARWQEQREALEENLEQQIPALRRQRRWLSLDSRAVAAVQPSGSLLIEYVRYQPRDFRGLCTGKEDKDPTRYLALVLIADRPDDIRLIDLGEAAPLDRLAQACCSLWRSRQARAALADQIVTPVVSHAAAGRKVTVAASGPLARVRFTELPGDVLVQRQITTARELLELPAAVNAEPSGGWLARLWQSLRRVGKR
jgi:tetratricopeptide (TPR) repeat protein